MIKFDLTTQKEHSYLSNTIYHHKTQLIDEQISGYGTSFSKEISILKSISECIERYYLKNYFIERGHVTSNGIACGSTPEMAMRSAELELLERHVFISHWHLKISPTWLNFSTIESYFDKTDELKLILMIENLNYFLRFGLLGIINNNYVTIAIISKKNETGYAISTAASINIKTAISKCLEDSARVVDLVESRKNQNKPLFATKTLNDLKKPGDHLEYYLNPENWISHDWFLESNESVRNYQLENIITDYIEDTYLKEISLYIASAKCQKSQKLYFGNLKKSDLNDYNLKNLNNLCPHPLA